MDKDGLSALDALKKSHPALWNQIHTGTHDGSPNIAFEPVPVPPHTPPTRLDISRHNGARVIHLPYPLFRRSAGFAGRIWLAAGSGMDTVKHEFGHLVQEQDLAGFQFWHGIALPSIHSVNRMNPLHIPENHRAFYFSKPWERMADVFGGVDRQQPRINVPGEGLVHRYLYGSLPIGILYYEWLRNTSILDFESHSFFESLQIKQERVSYWFGRMAEENCFEQ